MVNMKNVQCTHHLILLSASNFCLWLLTSSWCDDKWSETTLLIRFGGGKFCTRYSFENWQVSTWFFSEGWSRLMISRWYGISAHVRTCMVTSQPHSIVYGDYHIIICGSVETCNTPVHFTLSRGLLTHCYVWGLVFITKVYIPYTGIDLFFVDNFPMYQTYDCTIRPISKLPQDNYWKNFRSCMDLIFWWQNSHCIVYG